MPLRPSDPPRAAIGRRVAPAFPAAAALAAVLAVLALGCGHPATRDDCEAIFKRIAEIELRAQNVTDPKAIEERTAAVRAARGQDQIDRCVGRRITDRAVACVREANTPHEVDRCLE